MDDLIKVRLVGPAKVGGRWLKQGDETVTADEKQALEEAGLLLPDDLTAAVSAIGQSGEKVPTVPEGSDIVFDQDAFNAAVSAEAIKLARQAFDGELDRMEAELKDIVALTEKEKAELLSRLDDTGKLLTAERQKSADLAEKLTAAEAEIATLKSAQTDDQAKPNTPPSESVAKTAPKKGAATTTKG